MTTETAESSDDSSTASRATRQAVLARMRRERHDFVPETWSTRWRRHRRRVGVVAIVLLLVVMGGIVTARLIPDAEGTVRSYLEAIHDGDVEAALEYVEHRPTGQEARFLVPEAMSQDWSIVGVSGPTRDGDDEVNASIESHGSVAHASFHADQDEKGDWYIDDPFEYVEFLGSPFEYAEVNGEVAEPGVYRVFPGAYTFRHDIDGLLSIQDTPQLMMPRHDSSQVPVSADADIELGDNAPDRIQEAVNTQLDACAEALVSDPSNCPFGTSVSRHPSEGSLPFTPKDLHWTIKDYPMVKVDETAPERYDRSPPLFTAEIVQEGIATLSGTRVVDRRTEEFTLECPISGTTWSVHIAEGGEIDLSSDFTPGADCEHGRQ
ncbi:MAG TPA: hypothetical protein H9902_11515 [Candidatus Stackebrandtia faecavium]|nr:hypothetical protein [Candidatus Stackebrandtia faecavium]